MLTLFLASDVPGPVGGYKSAHEAPIGVPRLRLVKELWQEETVVPSAAEVSQPGLMASMRPKPVEGEARDEEPASPRASQLLNKVFLLQRCLLVSDVAALDTIWTYPRDSPGEGSPACVTGSRGEGGAEG